MSEQAETPENPNEENLEASPMHSEEIENDLSHVETVAEFSEDVQATQAELATVTADEAIIAPDTHAPTIARKKDDVVIMSRTVLNYVVIALVFFAVGFLLGGIVLGNSVDSDAIEASLHNVLVDAGLVLPYADMSLLARNQPFLGTEDAPIVIVEFSAYACPYCGRHFEETFTPLIENYGQYIRYVYRDFPVIYPDTSIAAAFAANCADEQGAFWDYHTALFEHQDSLSPSYYLQLAGSLGLDTTRFNQCYYDQDPLDEITSDLNTAQALNLESTPSFYINGKAHIGARSYEYFEQVILRELEAQGITVGQ